MDERVLKDESVEILNLQLGEAMLVRDYAMRARWVSLRGDCLALPPMFERAAAHLQAHVDRLADRVLALDTTPLGGPRVLFLSSGMDPRPTPEHMHCLLRMLARLLRATRLRCDIVRALGDKESANLLSQARRGLELLVWQVDYLAHAED
jgi:DNA-binding ferritin-like protein